MPHGINLETLLRIGEEVVPLPEAERTIAPPNAGDRPDDALALAKYLVSKASRLLLYSGFPWKITLLMPMAGSI